MRKSLEMRKKNERMKKFQLEVSRKKKTNRERERERKKGKRVNFQKVSVR